MSERCETPAHSRQEFGIQACHVAGREALTTGGHNHYASRDEAHTTRAMRYAPSWPDGFWWAPQGLSHRGENPLLTSPWSHVRGSSMFSVLRGSNLSANVWVIDRLGRHPPTSDHQGARAEPYGHTPGATGLPVSGRTAWPPLIRAPMAERQALLPPDEPAEGPEPGAVPDLQEGRFENVSHVEREVRIEPPPGIDEGVVFHRRAGQLVVPRVLGLAVVAHHLLDREVRVRLDLERMLPAPDRPELLGEPRHVHLRDLVLVVGGVLGAEERRVWASPPAAAPGRCARGRGAT